MSAAGRGPKAQLIALVVAASGCASIIGLDGEYRETNGEAAGGAPASGVGGSNDSTTAGDASLPSAGASSSQGGATAALEPMKLRRVLSGQVVLESGKAEAAATLDGVDEARSFLVFGASFDSTNASRTEISGQLRNGSQASFRRLSDAAGAPNVPITYYVAEFESGVHVQRGSTTLNDAVTKVKLPKAAPLTRSVPLVTFRNSGTVYGLDDHVRAKLTLENELTLEMYQAFGDGVVEWQVVTFDDAEVQTGDVELAGSALTLATSLGAAVDPAHTWLLFSYQVANVGDGASDLMLRGGLEAKQLTFDRSAVGASAKLSYYTVTVGAAAAVQRGEATFAAGAETQQVALGNVDLNRSLALAAGNYLRSGSTSLASANNPGSSSFQLSLDAGGLTLLRGQASTSAAVAWQVLQFR
jgi:hypothetical protein